MSRFSTPTASKEISAGAQAQDLAQVGRLHRHRADRGARPPIDVNTGRYVGKNNLEETILKTNLEAVKEIAYQLRLRNIGGIIIIDFIDMEKKANQERVFSAFKEALKRDKSKTNVLPMSELGLIQMTRKRTRRAADAHPLRALLLLRGRGLHRLAALGVLHHLP